MVAQSHSFRYTLNTIDSVANLMLLRADFLIMSQHSPGLLFSSLRERNVSKIEKM